MLPIFEAAFHPDTYNCRVGKGVLYGVNRVAEQAKEIGKEIFADIPQLSLFKGYDHNFIINGTGYRKSAEVSGSDQQSLY